MLRLLSLSTLACILFFASCTNDTEPAPPIAPAVDTTTAEKPYESPVPPGVNAITFPDDGYKKYDPVAFVGYLKDNVASGTVLLHQAPKDWIKKKHLAGLVALLDDTEPSAGIVLINAGPNPPDNIQSSVGAEALLIIESYRQKEAYPAVPGSLQFIKVLNKSKQDPSKLILVPQAKQIEEAKEWAAKQ
ncbi:hypothetical protein BH09BAC1_BH09BAC1_09610 [soil metagenome]